MSQKDPKRPGSRDISELKARLGLKKGTSGPQPAARPNGAGGVGGGVVPPPGLNLPPPPGARPPPGAVIPSASDDPFGAMNAMAQIGAAQRAPEIVIVNDGKPVESVSTGERAAKIGKLAGLTIAPLILGLLVGQIAKEGKIYNAGLADVRAINGDVDRIKRKLGEIKSAFDNSGSLRDQKVSAEVSKILQGAQKDLAKNNATVFRAKQNALAADISGEILAFYSMVQQIDDLIADHVATARMEEAAIKTGADQIAKIGVKPEDTLAQVGIPYRVGLVLTNPEEGGKDPQAARLVEIGAPLCGGDFGSARPADSGACRDGEPPAGFLYRFNDSVAWYRGRIHVPGSLDAGERFPLGELILLAPTGTLDALVKTSGATQAEVAYFKRLQKIKDKVDEAYERADALSGVLKKRGQQSDRFTFFM